MPPQEYISQPGIDDELPQNGHDTDRYENQDPLTRFEIVERLGFGSTGSSVFKAIDKADNLKQIAIKKIPLATISDGFALDDLNHQVDVDYFISCIADHGGHWREDLNFDYDDYCYEDNKWKLISRNVAGLDRIVHCLGVYQTETELWLSLEFCGGGSVEDLIRLSDGPLAESEIGWIMSQILQGLVYLHNKDHVHGDIKASNILLTSDGKLKLGGSGSIMNHKEGAGERKRRRRSLTMTEFPASWLAPESNPSSPATPTAGSKYGVHDITKDSENNASDDLPDSKQRQWMPNASVATDVWAIGVACIELSQGRPPGPEMPILALFGEQRIVGNQTMPLGRRSDGSLIGNTSWQNLQQNEPFGAAGMGMSEEMWAFIARCLTPEPEDRPSVQDLLEDPFIERYSKPSTEFQERIQRMMEFVDQCTVISSDMLPFDKTVTSLSSSSSTSSSTLSTGSSSLTLSPSKASYLVDMKLDEASIAPWLIPIVRPRVDSAYDPASFFDEAGLPTTPPEPGASNNVSGWKHQRASHPVVKQALLCDQAGYMIFRHSRSPSLATIVEQLEDDREFGMMPFGDHLASNRVFGSNRGNDNIICEWILS
ncbi:hypothetical protein BGZ76_010078 [Entomortierella beljakovae]|nr:hypothetical protein BGZ76_010078 [Entomortierella beljakovae]